MAAAVLLLILAVHRLSKTETTGDYVAVAEVSFEGNHNRIIAAVSIGVAAIPVGAPEFCDEFPDWAQTILNSGISTGSLLVIVLNLVFNHLRTRV